MRKYSIAPKPFMIAYTKNVNHFTAAPHIAKSAKCKIWRIKLQIYLHAIIDLKNLIARPLTPFTLSLAPYAMYYTWGKQKIL
jgi:hypothetical protein